MHFIAFSRHVTVLITIDVKNVDPKNKVLKNAFFNEK